MPVINAPVSIRAWKGIAPSFALVAVAMSRNSERADQPLLMATQSVTCFDVRQLTIWPSEPGS